MNNRNTKSDTANRPQIMFAALQCIILLFSGLVLIHTASAQRVQDYCVPVTAQKAANGRGLVLQFGRAFAPDTTLPDSLRPTLVPTQYQIFRKRLDTKVWQSMPLVTLEGSATQYTDFDVSSGAPYEYRINSKLSYTDTAGMKTIEAIGYLYGGFEVAANDYRGRIIVVLDTTVTQGLESELKRLESDLIGDGWQVNVISCSRTETPVQIKNRIKAIYDTDTRNTKAVLLLGHVPVPYSGNIAPDGHSPDHQGAWPADVYYADMDGNWTDNTVNTTAADRPENRNIPGDGKFDQNTIPSDAELMVGRVDFAKMEIFGKTEQTLLRQYLDRNHNYRHGNIAIHRRALVDDDFKTYSMLGSTAFGATGWRGFTPCVGVDSIAEEDFITTTSTHNYLFAYGAGGGMYHAASGVGTTRDFVNTPAGAVFNGIFGSYKGDWDSDSNLVRAPLASSGIALASMWSGRPVWALHHLALGEPIGFCTRTAQNNNNLYEANVFTRSIHIALMGDPTLRIHTFKPAADLVVQKGAERSLNLSWQPSADCNTDTTCRYYVYRRNPATSRYDRITTRPIASTQFTDTLPSSGIVWGDSIYYMVRAVRLETSASGSYYNVSQGVIGHAESPIASRTDATSPQFRLYPNPAHNYLYIAATDVDLHAAWVVLYDVTGRETLRQPLQHNRLEIGHLPAGVYGVTVLHPNGSFYAKVVKE